MNLFSCRACEVYRDALVAEREARARDGQLIRDLTAKLTALADLRAQQLAHLSSPEAAAERASIRASSPRASTGLLNPSRLPRMMRSVLEMGGHYRPAAVDIEALRQEIGIQPPLAPVEGESDENEMKSG